jgi:hypothetical protein
MKQIKVVIVNFDEVARYDDEGIWHHVVQTCRLSKKRLIPKSLRFNGCRISRQENEVIAHLYHGDREVMQFGFARMPDFSRTTW